MRMWSALLVVGIVATLCRSGDGTSIYGRPNSYNQYEERDRTSTIANAGTSRNDDRVISQGPRNTVIRDSSSDAAYASAEAESERERRIVASKQGGRGGQSGQKGGYSAQKGSQSVQKADQSVPKGKSSGQKIRGQVSGRDQSIKQGPNNWYPQEYPQEYSQRDEWGQSISRREDEDLTTGGYYSQYRNKDSSGNNDGYYSSQHRGSEVDVNDYRSRVYNQGGNNQGRYNQGGYNPGGYNQGRGQGYKKVENRPKNRRPASYQEKYESQWIGNKASASADQDRYGYNTPYGSGYGEHSGAQANAESNKYDQSWEKYY